jgi:hypothetical protein
MMFAITIVSAIAQREKDIYCSLRMPLLTVGKNFLMIMANKKGNISKGAIFAIMSPKDSKKGICISVPINEKYKGATTATTKLDNKVYTPMVVKFPPNNTAITTADVAVGVSIVTKAPSAMVRLQGLIIK